MAELKTKETDASVEAFLAGVEHDVRRADARVVCAMMEELSGEPPRLWGKDLVGFGRYAYTYASGHSGEWFRVGFSPRKSKLVLYIMPGYEDLSPWLSRLGKHKIGKSCLYVNKLADVDLDVLRELIEASLQKMRELYD